MNMSSQYTEPRLTLVTTEPNPRSVASFIGRIEWLCSNSPAARAELRTALRSGSNQGFARMHVDAQGGYAAAGLNRDVALFVACAIASLYRRDKSEPLRDAVGIGGLYGAYAKERKEESKSGELTATALRLAALSRLDRVELIDSLRRVLPLLASNKSTVRPNWTRIARDISRWDNSPEEIFAKWSAEFYTTTHKK